MAAKSLSVRIIAFQPIACWLFVRLEMHAFDDAIGFQEKQPVLRRPLQDRTIVARPNNDVRTAT